MSVKVLSHFFDFSFCVCYIPDNFLTLSFSSLNLSLTISNLLNMSHWVWYFNYKFLFPDVLSFFFKSTFLVVSCSLNIFASLSLMSLKYIKHGYFRDYDEWIHLGEFLLNSFLLVVLMCLLKFFLCNLNFFPCNLFIFCGIPLVRILGDLGWKWW